MEVTRSTAGLIRFSDLLPAYPVFVLANISILQGKVCSSHFYKKEI